MFGNELYLDGHKSIADKRLWNFSISHTLPSLESRYRSRAQDISSKRQRGSQN
jgi:hypothetical protein